MPQIGAPKRPSIPIDFLFFVPIKRNPNPFAFSFEFPSENAIKKQIFSDEFCFANVVEYSCSERLARAMIYSILDTQCLIQLNYCVTSYEDVIQNTCTFNIYYFFIFLTPSIIFPKIEVVLPIFWPLMAFK